MTSSDMLDYTFGQLDEARRAAFEQSLHHDPELAERVALLGSSIARLVDDGEELEPPAGLASRTVDLVEARKRRPQFQDYAPTRVPFRWTDLAVAATVFLAGLLTLTIPVMTSRARMEQAACADNLRRLGVSLASYASTHGSFPFVPAGEPVGSYGVILNGTQGLSDPAILHCPKVARTASHDPLPDYERYHQILETSPETGRTMVRGHFAYNPGYLAGPGQPVPVPSSPPSVIPIAADGPACGSDGQILEGNSLNHGGRGQNVLFSDAHVEWKRNRWISNADSDFFLNAAHRPARGLHAVDSSLISSELPAQDR